MGGNYNSSNVSTSSHSSGIMKKKLKVSCNFGGVHLLLTREKERKILCTKDKIRKSSQKKSDMKK
jgi:uncharacterized protein YutD